MQKSALARYRALATPPDTRVQKIVLSLECVRWLPPRLDSPPIIVNIPQFRLFAFRTTQDAASDTLQMNVIIGSAFKARRTSVFSADMTYVVIHPYWDVPRSILVKELLPGIRANPEWVTARVEPWLHPCLGPHGAAGARNARLLSSRRTRITTRAALSSTQ